MEIEQLAVERPEALARVAVDPNTGIDEAKAQEIVEAAGFDAETAPRSSASSRGCGRSTATRTPRSSRSTRWSRPRTATSSRSTARSRSTRTPASATPTTRRSRTRPRPTRSRPRPRRRTSTTSSSTARSASSATAPGWSCRRSTSSPTPARSSPAQPKPANFLDIGGGASAEVMANGLHIILGDEQVKSVFVNVFGGITACDAVANGIVGALNDARRRGDQAARRAAGRQQRRGGPAHPRRGQPPAGDHRRDHGRRGPQGRRAGFAAAN